MLIPKPLILLIDAYDSFSNNIIALLETSLNVSVRTIKIDDPALADDAALHQELRHYAAVVCGPGPGHPANEEDVGIMRRIWKLSAEDLLPVLGICLGFQSLCLEFGGEVQRLRGPQHGIVRRVLHVGELKDEELASIFGGVGEIQATLYQSLCGKIGQDLISKRAWDIEKWEATQQCPDLIPLAWVESGSNDDTDCGVMDDRVLVAVKHRTKPFWALQYHPESICTNHESKMVIKNWFKQAQQWNQTVRQGKMNLASPIQGKFAVRQSLLHRYEQFPPSVSPGSYYEEIQRLSAVGDKTKARQFFVDSHFDNSYMSRTIKLAQNTSVPDIVEAIQDMRCDQIILESSNANETSIGSAKVRGRYSIIGLDIDDALRFEYRVGSDRIKVSCCMGNSGDFYHEIGLHSYGGVWPWLAHMLEKGQVSNANRSSPFCGGFMGYTTYEMGLEGIGVKSERKASSRESKETRAKMQGKRDETSDEASVRPDLCFSWVTRSAVVDHVENVIYLQELTKKGPEPGIFSWMDAVSEKLESLSAVQGLRQVKSVQDTEHSITADSIHIQTPIWYRKPPKSSLKTSSSNMTTNSVMTNRQHRDSVKFINQPKNEAYESKVDRCQQYIRSGDSYEICLTDQTLVTRLRCDDSYRNGRKESMDDTLQSLHTVKPAESTDAWSLYKTLRQRQPAPFASFLRLGSATLVSSSPERFLKWDEDNKCELRPMKGTVRKTSSVSTLAQASALLDVPKEKAENLMIVDLVRHDLHGVCGAGNVEVPRLMVVEEYATVFQMISIVEGRISKPVDDCVEKHMKPADILKAKRTRYTGLDVLAASLPPGSMTGAPKKRSCEILQEIEEGRDRSLYSGVVGYMDVGGRGDFSVTIRSLFRWDDEDIVEGGHAPNGGAANVKVPERTEVWHIGAGGAVTALSTLQGEREEMQTKLSGTLGVFR